MFLMVLEKILFILLIVGFFTLLERKILSYMQLRKGPNKVSIYGILQPIADAAKLLLKEKNLGKKINFLLFFLTPVIMLILTFVLWVSIPLFTSSFHLKISILIFLAVSSLGVYTTMGTGWFSNSKYSLIGSLRSMAQTISYEVSLILMIAFFILWGSSFEFSEKSIYYSPMFALLMFFPCGFMLFLTALAETNRAPFDFSEGESELVSGFNTEYASFEFAMLFMSEYCNILIFSFFLVFIFLGLNSWFVTTIFLLAMSSIFIIVRGSYPRLRYDKLMILMWKSFLNISITMLLLMIMLI